MTAHKNIDVNFTPKLNIKNMNKFSEEEVDKILSRAPEAKLHFGIEWSQAEYEKAKSTIELKQEIIKYRMQATTMKDKLSSDKDREAWTMSQTSVQDKQLAELEKSLEVKLAQFKHQYWDDMFISARKQANKIEKEIDANRQADRYYHE